jgi:hypothetical protein
MRSELYPFEAGELRCPKCDSPVVNVRHRERDHAGPERLACNCEGCLFAWPMACKPAAQGTVGGIGPMEFLDALSRMAMHGKPASGPEPERVGQTPAPPALPPQRRRGRRGRRGRKAKA